MTFDLFHMFFVDESTQRVVRIGGSPTLTSLKESKGRGQEKGDGGQGSGGGGGGGGGGGEERERKRAL